MNSERTDIFSVLHSGTESWSVQMKDLHCFYGLHVCPCSSVSFSSFLVGGVLGNLWSVSVSEGGYQHCHQLWNKNHCSLTMGPETKLIRGSSEVSGVSDGVPMQGCSDTCFFADQRMSFYFFFLLLGLNTAESPLWEYTTAFNNDFLVSCLLWLSKKTVWGVGGVS